MILKKEFNTKINEYNKLINDKRFNPSVFTKQESLEQTKNAVKKFMHCLMTQVQASSLKGLYIKQIYEEQLHDLEYMLSCVEQEKEIDSNYANEVYKSVKNPESKRMYSIVVGFLLGVLVWKFIL